MLIYNSLKKKKILNVKKTNNYLFYEANKQVTNKVKNLYAFEGNNYNFNLIVKNILIRVFQNFEKYCEILESNFDKEITKEKLNKFFEESPYLQIENEKIYFPMFSKSLNYLFMHDFEKFNEYPYNTLKDNLEVSCLNFFDEYGFDVFSSKFTDLELIIKDKSSCAYYSKDFESIFVINNQGSLDIEICLFDKYLNDKKKDNLNSCLQKVMNYYFANNKSQFIRTLYEEGLISKKMYNSLRQSVLKRFIKRNKKQEVKK